MRRYRRGDLIHVIKDLGPSMSHFESDTYAIVLGDYDTECMHKGEEDFEDDHEVGKGHQYSIYIRGKGSTSWYKHNQLEEVERNRIDLLKKWKDELKKGDKNTKDLDWIFRNGEMIFDKYHPSKWLINQKLNNIAHALDDCFNWGKKSKYEYNMSVKALFELAERFLLTGDKDGWIKFANTHKKPKGGQL